MKGRSNNEVDIPEYEGIYTISPNGDVYSYHKERKKLKPYTKIKGYLTVRLIIKSDAVVHAVHQLVAHAFLDNPNNYHRVRFKDGDKTNVHVDNLEWEAEVRIEDIPEGCTWVSGFEGEYYFDENRKIIGKRGTPLTTAYRGKKEYINIRKNKELISFSIDRLIEKTFYQQNQEVE